MSKSGSIRKTMIDGLPFNVAADANVAKTPEITKEPVRHSGGNMVKVTLATGNVESLTLILTPSEYQALKDISEKLETVTISYTTADGSVWRCVGDVNLDNYESEENRCDVTYIPSLGTWELSAAS